MTKKYLFYLIVFALLLNVFIACKNGSRSMFSKENGIEFDTLSYQKNYHLNNDSLQPSCNLRIRFVVPRESSKTDLTKLQNIFATHFFGNQYSKLKPHEAIEKYTHDYIESYIHEAESFKKQLVEIKEFEAVAPPENPVSSYGDDGELKTEKNSKEFFSYCETLRDSILYNQNGILSFQVNQITKKGSNNRFETFSNYVINIKTAELISENDIFSTGYDVALQKIIIGALLSQNNVKSIRELEDLGYFGIEEILPNKNFLVDEKGITYVFNKGEYSAYQLDAPTVFLSYDVLQSILKPNTIVSNLIK